MARGINKAIIVGTLGKDPEVRYTSSGTAVATISVATNESWKDKQTGELQERTEWHRIVVWGKLAEICEQYLRKGSQAYFEGKIQTRKWQGQDGQDRYTTEINASEMQMMGSGPNTGTHGNAQGSAQRPSNQRPMQQTMEPAPDPVDDDGFDDIPF